MKSRRMIKILMAFLLVFSALLGGGIPKAEAAVATWSNVNGLPANTTFTEVAYGDGDWLVFSSSGSWWELTGDSMLNLTGATPLCQVRSALYVEDEWIAGCLSGKIYFSADNGISWQEKQNAQNLTSLSLEGMAYDGSETLVLVGRTSTGSAGVIVTSDGVNWDISNQGQFQFWDVTYGEGKFIVVGQEAGEGVIYSSSDGEEWDKEVLSQPPTMLRGVAYGDGKFVAVGYDGTVGKIYVSEDGETWEEESPPINLSLANVNFGAGKFYAAGANRLVISSVDGLEWEIENTIAGTGAFSKVAAIDGRAYAIGQNLLQTAAVQAPVVDTTAPLLSGINYSNVTQTTATITATSNEDATLYYVITTSPTAPTKAQVISGQNETGVAAIKSGNSAVTANTAKEFQVTGLTAETQYYVYFVARDSSNNASDVSHTSFTTSAIPKTANPVNNSVTATPTSVTVGASITLTATGDRQAANAAVVGDERYIPVDWSSSDGATGTFSLSGSTYTSAYTPTTAGSYTITAKFQKKTWDGTDWVNSGSPDTKTATVTVNALVNAQTPSITTQPADQTVLVGDSATLSVTASVSDGGTLSYQWYSNSTNSNSGGTAISGANSSTYAAPTTSAGTTYYYVQVTNTNSSATGSQTASAKSDPAAVTVNALTNAEMPSITSQPADQTVNVGGNATLSVTASVSDGGTLSYQWYSNTTNSNSGGTAISGATSSSYTAPTTSAGTTYYYVEVTNTNSSATGVQTATAKSDPAAVTVNALTNAEMPSITSQPADQTVNVGGNATLSVTASVSDGGTLSYQWYSNTTNANSGGTAINGADSSTYSAPTTSAGTTYYYVEVTNTNSSATGVQTASAKSDPAAVTVNALTNAEMPSITSQPADKTVNVGDSATLSVTASVSDGGSLSYQWYSNTTNSNSGGTAISGANSSTYAAPTTSAGTTYYYVQVTNTNSSATGVQTASAKSDPAAVTVNALTNAEMPSITSQPADQTVNVGGNATLSVTASVSDGGTLSYQWYSNTTNSNSGGTAINGADSATYSAPTTSAGTTYYYVEVTNINSSATGVQTATAKSDPAAVTVNALTNAEIPSITSQPADQTVNVGGNATLSVTASVSDGGTLSYQWYSNTTNANSGGTAISGATSSSYTAPTTTAGTTYYYVEVTNTNSSATGVQTATAKSDPAAVTVNNRPAEPTLREIISVINPESITGVANGTPKEADALGLPKTVEVTLDNGSKLDIDVSWDVKRADYNPKDKDEQSFTVTGELVRLPNGVYNSRNLNASVRVTVEAAAQGDIVEVENPDDVTGLPNGTPKKAEALGLPEQVRVTLEDGTKLKVSVKWAVSRADYDPESEEEQSFTVTGELVKLPEGVTNSQDLEASIRVQVKAVDDGGGEDGREIVKVTQPAPITGVENGTRKTAKALGLPKVVKVTLDDGSTLRVEVKWDVDDADYDPDSRKKQRFTVKGELVDLPDDVDNLKNLGVSIRVTVDAVERDDDRDDDRGSRNDDDDDRPNEKKIRYGKVEAGDGEDRSLTILLEIIRKTSAGGKQVDEVELDKKTARDILEKADENEQDVIRMTIDDLSHSPADEVLVKVPESTIELLQDGKVDLEIKTGDVMITIPREVLAYLPQRELSFRIIPVRQQSEQHAEKVRQAAGGQNMIIVGKPVVIETNFSGGRTKVTFPLHDVPLPTAPDSLRSFLSSLAVYVEHSDGDKELLIGKIIYDTLGKPVGIEIEIHKFSTFTILSLPGNQQQVAHQAYMTGYPDGTFQPNRIMTRAEVAAVLASLMAEAGHQQATGSATAFADVPESHWAATAIRQVNGAGLMMGDGKGLFHPEENVTRAEMAAILVKMKNLTPQGKGNSFGDTPGHWAAASIAVAVEQGLMKGYADGSFRPNQGLTRAEAATLFNRLAGRGPLTGITKAIWSDVPLSHWAFAEIAEATQSHTAMRLENGTEKSVE